MTRSVWIVGLSLSLLVFGGFTLMCIAGLILHHHLNKTGIIVLIGNALISWMIVDYLLLKLRDSRKALLR